jgi:hypothetical protein
MSLLPALEASPVSEVIPPEIQKDEDVSVSVTPVAPQSYHDEPVVTRRELWSYYCVYHYIFLHCLLQRLLTYSLQCIHLEITYVSLSCSISRACDSSANFRDLSDAQGLGPQGDKHTMFG